MAIETAEFVGRATAAMGNAIDYFRSDRKARYQVTAEDVRWRYRRWGYWLGQVGLFALIVYRVGPNLFLFHSPFSPSLQDYVAQSSALVPIMSGVMAYHRDTGNWPYETWSLPPPYRPAGYAGADSIHGGASAYVFIVNRHTVFMYDLQAGSEGWLVFSPRYQGKVPAPLVEPLRVPASRGSTGEARNDRR